MSRSAGRGAEQWRAIVEGQRGSGLTVAAYCREHRISEGSFYTWKQRLRGPARPEGLPRPAFVEVIPAGASAAGTIEIGLRDGRCLRVWRGFDRELLIELIRTLEAAG